jgi:hypothetical protein
LNGVPICHCQWIGADEPGCQIFPIAVVVVFGKVEERTEFDVVAEEVVVEIDWYAEVTGDEGVVLAGHAVESRPIANNGSIKINLVIFLDST